MNVRSQVRLFFAVAFVLGAGAACVIGPKQDDPLTGPSATTDTGTTNEDAADGVRDSAPGELDSATPPGGDTGVGVDASSDAGGDAPATDAADAALGDGAADAATDGSADGDVGDATSEGG